MDGRSAEQPAGVATPSYRLLLAEEQAAQLRIGSWVGEAEDGTRRRALSTLRHLVGWSSANWRLLIGWYGCSHRHLEEARSRQKKGTETCFSSEDFRVKSSKNSLSVQITVYQTGLKLQQVAASSSLLFSKLFLHFLKAKKNQDELIMITR